MEWGEVLQAHYNVYKRKTIDCSNEQEREFLIDLILPKFPQYTRQQVDMALGYGCRNMNWDLAEILSSIEINIGEV
jgi:hypothetical protein